MPNNTLLPSELDALFQRIDAERGRQTQLRAAWQANAARIADVIGARWQIAPWVPADVIALTAIYDMDDEVFGAVAESAGQAGMSKGGLVEKAQIADLNATQLAALANPFSAEAEARRAQVLGPERLAATQARATELAAATELAEGGGLWRFLTENPVTRAGGQIMETTGGAIPEVVRTGAKGVIRTAVGVAQTPYEAVQAAAASRVRGIGDIGGALLEGDVSGALRAAPAAFGGQAFMPSTWQATTGGQAVAQLVETGEIDVGEGLFVGGTVRTDQQQRAREVRGTIGGEAWTIGRAMASTVLEPGSSPYGWVSGTIDAAAAVGLDPANYVGAGVAKARRAARVPTGAVAPAAVTRAARLADPKWRAVVEEAVGMIPAGTLGVRNAVLAPRAMKWVLGDDGRKVVQAFRQETSPTRIWLAMQRKIGPADARALAATRTDAEVIRILGEGFSGGRIRRLPTPGHWPGDNLPGMSVIARAADRRRIFGQVPETTWLDPDDDMRAMSVLYDTLGNSGILGAERRALTDGWIAAKSTGLKGDEYNAIKATWKAIDGKLVESGVPAELARRITDGRRAYGRDTDWLTDDFADGITNDFLGLAGGGPTMLAEALNSGMWLMEPSQLRAVRQQTSRLGRLTKRKGLAIPKAMAEFYTSTLWKPSVLARPAYITRVGGDEVARSMLGGEFRHATDFMLAMVGHGYGSRLFSNVIRKVGGRYGADLAGDPTNLGRFLNKIDADIDAAQAAGNTDEVTRLLAERARVADKIGEGFEQEYKRAMIGEARAKSVSTMLRDDFVAEYQMRTGNIVRRSKADPTHKDQWVDGLGWELGKIHGDRIARRVANGGLLVGDNPGQFRAGIDGIEDWLVANGDGVRDELAAMYPDIDWADPANARRWIDHQLAIVDHFTGMNAEIRQMVATGRLGDKGAYFPVAGRMETAPHVYDHLRAWHEAPDSPEWVRWNQTMYDRDAPSLVKRGQDLRDDFLGWFFGDLYGKTSDYLARNPTFNRFLWKHYDDMAGLLTKDEAAKALAKLDNAKLPKDMDVRIRAKLRAADGTERLDDIDKLAKGYALDDTQALLFDVSKRSQFFDVAKILFPFGEAWKEFLVTWSRALYERPELVNTLRKVVVGGRQGDPDRNGQGFFYRNAYGDEVFAYPGSGAVAEYLTGVNVAMEGQLLGLSLGTQIMPGIGPVGSVLVSQLVPDTPTFDTVAELLFPFGSPEERGDMLNVLPIPSWAQKIGAAIPGLNDAFGLDNPQKNLVYGNTYFEVSAVLAASGKYDLTNPQDLDQLDEDARHKAKVLSMMRGIMQATGPTSPGLVYKVATLQGDVTVPLLTEDLRKMQEQDYDTAVARFLEKYGDGVFIYLASKSYAVNPGIAPTDEFGQWEREHGDLIDRYKRVGAYFGPAGTEFSIDVWGQQVRAGRRVRRDSPNDRIAEAHDIVARSAYFAAKDKIGPNPTPEQKAWLKQVEADLMDEHPGFVLTSEGQEKLKKQIAELDRASNDREVQQLPAGEALMVYMQRRDEVLRAQVDQGVTTSTTSISRAAGGAHLRQYLRDVAADLITDHPEFQRLWDDVLSREIPEEVVDAAA